MTQQQGNTAAQIPSTEETAVGSIALSVEFQNLLGEVRKEALRENEEGDDYVATGKVCDFVDAYVLQLNTQTDRIRELEARLAELEAEKVVGNTHGNAEVCILDRDTGGYFQYAKPGEVPVAWLVEFGSLYPDGSELSERHVVHDQPEGHYAACATGLVLARANA